MRGRFKRLSAFLLVICLAVFVGSIFASRDDWQQPEKVMDVIGVRPGMVIGEPGAGRGYFTFKLSKRVGNKGLIYANDISDNVLDDIRDRCEQDGITNIKTILGELEDPLFPKRRMDMIIMVYVFHDLEKPVEFLRNLKPSMKLGAKLVLLEREPEKSDKPYDKSHFYSQEKILRLVKEAGYKLVKIETFLPRDTIYILRPLRY